MNAIDLPIWRLALLYGLLVIPVLISSVLRLGIVRSSLVAVVRMTAQLSLVGLYLGYVFDLNNVWLNVAWVFAMIGVANTNVLRSAGLKARRLFGAAFAGLVASTVSVLAVFLVIVVQPDPVYDARYLIPLAGMLLGNCMRGNIVALERYYSGVRANQKRYVSDLLMGATIAEASREEFRNAVKAALAPTVSAMATMGIVSLPGMMTGQILGGSTPVTAIKYQLAIMVAIFVTVATGAVVNLALSRRFAFTSRDLLDLEIFRN